MGAPKAKHVIMILLDAFRPDYPVIYNLPHITALAREGVWVAECRSVLPSTTTANLTSFITGALPARTGIPNNSRYDRDTDAIISPLRDNAVPTIAERFRTAQLSSISVNFPMLVNRGVDIHVTGTMDTVINMLAEHQPHLLVYYNGQTDAVGHNYGPFSPEMASTTQAIDGEIGRLLQYLKDEDLISETTLILASDHGMSPNNEEPIQPPLLEAIQNTGLVVARHTEHFTPDTDIVWLQNGCAFLYWRNGHRTPDREAKLLAALDTIHGVDILDERGIRAKGADPTRAGDLVVVPQEGRCIVKGSGTGGLHGRPPEAHSTLLFWGAGINRRAVVPRASITDVVPTILSLLGLPGDDQLDGQVLTGVLQQSTEPPAGEAAQNARRPDFYNTVKTFLEFTGKAVDFTFGMEAEVDRVVEYPYLLLDLEDTRMVKSIEFVAAAGDMVVGPSSYRIAISLDNNRYQSVADGSLPPLKNGESYHIKFEQPLKVRFIAVAATERYNQATLAIEVLRLWVDVESVRFGSMSS